MTVEAGWRVYRRARNTMRCAGLGLLAVLAAGTAQAQALDDVSYNPGAVRLQPVRSDAMQAQLRGFIASFWPEASARGISRAVFESAFDGLQPDPDVLQRLETQPEHVRAVSEYVTQLVSAARIEAGRRKLAELGPLLSRIEAAYGVDRHVLLAIWGVESNYGTAMGDRSVVRSLATLAAGDRRRAAYWKKELLTVLCILQRERIPPARVTGSWAGAMGHTQFMPASYIAHAVDFDRDGKRDIWNSVADALASTAHYLRAMGWIEGEPWGYEAILPRRFDFAHTAPGASKSAFEWLELGLKPPPGRRFVPSREPLRLLLPAGAQGPALLVTRNFRAIMRYNNSVAYALAVGHLADRIAGGPEFATPWPAGDRALEKSERLELQERLTATGFDAGDADGLIGERTKAAIRAFQQEKGLPADGHADVDLLQQLRDDGPT